MSLFENCFTSVVGQEGGYTDNPQDPGNWTGGRCGVGECKGTKYGISAAAYPKLDIAGLGIAEAQAIYKADYWGPIKGDLLPSAVALLVFDAAVNSGPVRAIKWLQTALGVAADGVIGPATSAAIANCAGRGATVLAEYSAQRLLFLTSLPTWRTFGIGWARRVCTIQYEALRIGGS